MGMTENPEQQLHIQSPTELITMGKVTTENNPTIQISLSNISNINTHQDAPHSQCTDHRVQMSDQYECRKLKSRIGFPINEEDIQFEKLKKNITVLKENLGVSKTKIKVEEENTEQPIDDINPENCSQAPVVVLCVHPSPPNQLIVHWKPTIRLPISGYKVRPS
jgi:hypothetical protein